MSQNKYFGDTGLDSLEVGGNNPIFSFLTSAMASGKALADDGKVYDSVQTAQDNASKFVLVGPGTFNESVIIDTAGLTVIGSGYDTFIDGGTIGDALALTEANITVRNLSVRTAGGNGNSNEGVVLYSGTPNADNCTIDSVVVRDADTHGFSAGGGSDHMFVNCVVESCDETGFHLNNTPRSSVIGCRVEDGAGSSASTTDAGIAVYSDDCVVVNNFITGYGDSAGNGDGIRDDGRDDYLVGANRIHNSADAGIRMNGTQMIVFNNRISNSGSAGSIADASTGSVTDDNKTGEAN